MQSFARHVKKFIRQENHADPFGLCGFFYCLDYLLSTGKLFNVPLEHYLFVSGYQELLKEKRMGRKPNYGYEKRQKELARKAKKEEKRKLKAEDKDRSSEENSDPDVISESEMPIQ